MYRVCIIRPGQPAEQRTCNTGGDLRTVVYDMIRAEGGTITDNDHTGLIAMVGDARSQADIHGFAALKFGDAAITIRPHTAQENPMPEAKDNAPGTEPTATLFINITDSRCGHCRQPTLPRKTHHTDISGWSPVPGGGCGARFVDTSSDYPGHITAEVLRRIRPDLPTHGQ